MRRQTNEVDSNFLQTLKVPTNTTKFKCTKTRNYKEISTSNQFALRHQKEDNSWTSKELLGTGIEKKNYCWLLYTFSVHPHGNENDIIQVNV